MQRSEAWLTQIWQGTKRATRRSSRAPVSTLAAKDQENSWSDAEQGRQSTDEGHGKGCGIQCLPCFRLYHQGLLSGLPSPCASWQSLEEESATCQGPQQISLLLGVWLPGLRAKRVQLVTLGTAFPESPTAGFCKGHHSLPRELFLNCSSHLWHPPELQT